jgi:predicted amidohydrolase YtcJ
LGGEAAAQAAPANPADLLLLDGHIYTSSPARPWVRAVAIRGQRILAIGSDDEIRKFRGPRTRVIELGGRMAMPGIIDSHMHFLDGSVSLEQLNLEGAETVAEIERRVRDYAAAHPDRGWLQGRGWAYDVFKPSGLPTRQILDEIVPERPVVLESYDGHTSWVNSRALVLAAITRDTPDPKHGDVVTGFIVHDPKTGEPTGVLKEDAASDLVRVAIPELSREEKLRALRSGLAEANRHGVTSAVNLTPYSLPKVGRSLEEFELYDELRRRGELTLRMSTALLMEPELTEKTLARYEEGRRRFHDEWVRAGVIKAYLDGVIESHTAALLEPYADDPKLSGSMNYTPEQYRKNLLELDRRGFQVSTHAIGDKAIRTALDAYEAAEQANGPRDRRFRIEHIENINPADIPRFGRLRVIASMQPFHAYPEPNLWNVWARNVGPARLPYSFAWHELLASGARLVFGSDWPIVSLDPFIGIQNAVTRQDWNGRPPEGFVSAQRVTLEQALAAYTRDGAYAEFEENLKGSLEPGKLADVIVLSQDVFSVNPLEISRTRVLLTVVGGRIMHREGL